MQAFRTPRRSWNHDRPADRASAYAAARYRRGRSSLLSFAVTPAAHALTASVETTPPTITVAAVGDIHFSGSVASLVSAKGPRAPFRSTARILRAADVTVGNLETALSRRGRAVPGKTFTFRGTPRAVTGLKYAGFDFLGLANNHARDYGSLALKDTVRNLDRAGIAHAGAGRNRKAAFAPAIIERNGAKVAFLAFSQIGPSTFRATSSRSGTAYTMSRSHCRPSHPRGRQELGLRHRVVPLGHRARLLPDRQPGFLRKDGYSRRGGPRALSPPPCDPRCRVLQEGAHRLLAGQLRVLAGQRQGPRLDDLASHARSGRSHRSATAVPCYIAGGKPRVQKRRLGTGASSRS